MDDEIQSFIITLSEIGSREESLYDTLIRDSIREMIVTPPFSGNLIVTPALELSQTAETERLVDALRSLLVAFERSKAAQTLESAIKDYVLSLPLDSEQRTFADEIFGDYFDESTESNRELPASIRNFFYSDKCYIAVTIVPAILVGLVMYAFTPQEYGTLYLLAVMFICFVVFLAGDCLYDYLNGRIQRYEGKPRSGSA